MISFLRGIVSSKDAAGASLDVGGVGYTLAMTHDAVASLPALGEEAVVVCRMIINENAIALYGFSGEEERLLFDNLITVSGVGPKTALAALSCLTARELASAICRQDVKALSRIPGVGKKSASRIALELKDKFPDTGPLIEGAPEEGESLEEFSGVVEALEQMGFTSGEIASALKGVDPALPESMVLQTALKHLAR